ncbi:MAG: hypothetical protein R2813_14065 [Flavobacteriales bacterium]
MKQTFFLLLFLIVNIAASANNYKLDESNLNVLFESSCDISYMLTSSELMKHGIESAAAAGEKRQVVGAIIAFVGPVGGYIVGTIAYFVFAVATLGLGAYCFPIFYIPIFLPYHRWYLGTNGNGANVGLLYCVTLNWCGVLSFIDGIMLLIDDTEEKYIENPQYVMWID